MRFRVVFFACVILNVPFVFCSLDALCDSGGVGLPHAIAVDECCSTTDHEAAINMTAERLQMFTDEFRNSIVALRTRISSLEESVLHLQHDVSSLQQAVEQKSRGNNMSSSQPTTVQHSGVGVSVSSPITITIHSGQH